MVKHGASHAAAALICMLAGTLLTDAVKQSVYHWPISRNLMAQFWRQTTVWQVDPDSLLRLLLIGFLGFIWGIAFKLSHADRNAEQ